MLKLYNLQDSKYWETWANDNGSHTVHWGSLGSKGESIIVRRSLFKNPAAIIRDKINTLIQQGFAEVDIEDHATLLIEYSVDEIGDATDLEKRHALQERMDETLGWSGLGHCDGGSIGSGTMEVCCLVVSFTIAKDIIAKDLAETEFANYTRIYDATAGV